MDEPILVVISLTMFVGSYLAGFIPLFFPLNEKRVRIASIFGAGLLVGTAFCVIIPEGINSLIESSSPADHHHDRQIANVPFNKNDNPKEIEDGGKMGKRKPAEETESVERRREVDSKNWKENGEKIKKRKSGIVDGEANGRRRRRSEDTRPEGPKVQPEGKVQQREEEAEKKKENGGKPEGQAGGAELNGTVGVSLLVGFLFMHVVDQLSKLSHSRNRGVSTLGLVVHAFADGIAMGSASSAGSQLELQILVFVAIMLHKAPTAFALVSILLASGLDKARVRRHLLIFSLAAPLGTVLTYAFLHAASPSSIPSTIPGSAPPAVPSSNFTGVILLFSAGTFLYIATVHVLPELMDSKCSSTLAGAGMSGSRELLLGGGDKLSGPQSSSSRFSLVELCLFCASSLIPAFISSITHGAHGH